MNLFISVRSGQFRQHAVQIASSALARLRFWPAFKRSTGSCSSKVVRRRSLTREGRCARRVTSRCRERARAQRRTREQDSFPLHLCLTHSLRLRAVPPQARTNHRLPAGWRRRLARASARPRARDAGWPEAGRGQRARAAGLHREEYCSSRVPSTSTISSRIRLDKAGRKRSGYRTLRARSLNHSAAIRSTAGPSPAGHSGGSGGRGSPPADHPPRSLTRPPNPDCAGRHLSRRARARTSRKG